MSGDLNAPKKNSNADVEGKVLYMELSFVGRLYRKNFQN
jgi:hypothetical protein